MWQWNPYVPWTIFATLTCIGAGAWVGVRSRSKAAREFVFITACLTLEGLGLSIDLCGATLETKSLGVFLQYAGFCFVPTASLRFGLTNTGRTWMSRPVFLLCCVPGVLLLLGWLTNGWHHAVEVSNALAARDGFVMRHTVAGWGFWAFVLVAYAQVGALTIIYGFEVLYGSPLGRRQAVLLLLGTLCPWLSNVVFLTGKSPDPALDLTVFGYVGTTVLWAIALTRGRMIELVPAARNLVFERLADAVVVLDGSAQVVDGNAALSALVGIALPQLPGQTLDALGLRDAVTVTEFVRGAHTFSVGRNALPDGGQVLVLRDVTEKAAALAAQEKAAKEAAALAEARTAFLARMSHEVRTPLYGILGAAELALDQPLAERPRELLEAVRRSGGGLLAVVDEILDFSRLDAGQVRAEVRDVDLVQLIDDLQTVFSGHARAKGLKLLAELELGPADDELRWVRSDGQRLRQVLTNLLANAIKFTEAGEVVLGVSAAREGARLKAAFTVRDTGPGIPPEATERIFEAFAQADDSVSRRYGGTGLGLSIARGLVETLGGSISVSSVVGRGSTFTVSLTVDEGREPAPDSAPHREPRAGLVLVVDDHPVGRSVSKAMLEREGCVVETSASGEETLAMVTEGRYALVLLDVRLPDVDGREVLARLRARGVTTPVVWLTADIFGHELQEPVLPKPFRAEALHAVLERFMPRRAGVAPRAVFPHVTEAFAESSQRELDALDQAVARNNRAEMTRLLHELKGSAGFAGATEVANLCATGEEVAVVLPRLREARSRDLQRLRGVVS